MSLRKGDRIRAAHRAVLARQVEPVLRSSLVTVTPRDLERVEREEREAAWEQVFVEDSE